MSISANTAEHTSLLSPIERLLIEHECQRQVIRYCTTADHHDTDGFLGIFTSDAVWNQPDGSVYHGHEQIRGYFVGRPKTPVRSHICSNVLIEVLDANNARGSSNATVLRAQRPGDADSAEQLVPVAVLEYEDAFTRQADGSWKISRRSARLIFSADAKK